MNAFFEYSPLYELYGAIDVGDCDGKIEKGNLDNRALILNHT